MMSDSAVVTIDSTLATKSLCTNKKWRDLFQKSFTQSVILARDGMETPRKGCVFSELTDYLAGHVTLRRSDIEKFVLSGFRQGAEQLAQLTFDDLAVLIGTTGANLQAIDSNVQKFLHDNLRALHRAHSGMEG